MNKTAITYGILGIVIGLAVGFFGANYLNRNAATETGISSANLPAGAPQVQNPTGQLADVQKVLDLAKNEPDNFDAQIEAGEMYAQIERFDKALEFYERAQKIKPDDFQANVKLGNAFFDAKQFEKAEEFYAKAIVIDPKDPNVRTDLGLTYFLREPSDPDRAIAEYKKSLEIDSNHELTLQNLLAALKEKGDKDELAKTLAKLKEVNPNNPVIETYGSK